MSTVRGSVYSALGHRLATFPGEVYPFHVGDTWLRPAPGCEMHDLHPDQYPGLNRYTPVQGRASFLDALVERVRARTGEPTERDNVLVTAGATGGLAAIVGTLVQPGEEVLLLAPYWPLIEGMVGNAHGVAVPVPFLGLVDGPEAAREALEARRTPRTVAVYLNTPNNPTGRVIPRPWLEAVVEWARRHDLWILADEVYEDYSYDGPHTHTRPLAPERTFAAYSFSKAYGMAGNRTGYVVGPKEVMTQVQKISVHAFYSTPTAGQIAAERVLARGDEWLRDTAARYRAIGAEVAGRLGTAAPQGSTFLFLDVAERLDERGLGGFLEDCADRGVFLAPGPSFGPYPTHIRLCFTAAAPEVTLRGTAALASLLGR